MDPKIESDPKNPIFHKIFFIQKETNKLTQKFQIKNISYENGLL